MFLARVKGEVISTIKHASWQGRRALLVDRVGGDGRESGAYVVAYPVVDAGVNDMVLVLDEGNSARQIVGDASAPIRTLIVGIVDEVATG